MGFERDGTLQFIERERSELREEIQGEVSRIGGFEAIIEDSLKWAKEQFGGQEGYVQFLEEKASEEPVFEEFFAHRDSTIIHEQELTVKIREDDSWHPTFRLRILLPIQMEGNESDFKIYLTQDGKNIGYFDKGGDLSLLRVIGMNLLKK